MKCWKYYTFAEKVLMTERTFSCQKEQEHFFRWPVQISGLLEKVFFRTARQYQALWYNTAKALSFSNG